MALLAVGLGNPGSTYANTRHNAGFMVVDRVAERLGCSYRRPLLHRYQFAHCSRDGEVVYLAKPLTYMNLSGEVLPELLRKTGCDLSQLVIVCDNLDLPIGTCRLKYGGSSAGHNGLASIIDHAASAAFKRLYVGIGRPPSGGIVEYVLGAPRAEELAAFTEAIDRAARGLVGLIDRPIGQVMNELNQRKANPAPED